ncbi:MAG TPA: histidine phosphatase family protein [Opitutaceae bacterium]|nr:histidine phosphatase family protein [Opitutaceae bacterium]
MSVSIIFETHSLTEDNERGIASGWLPGKLSSRGRELARELGDRRLHDRISAVFPSDLARAVETAVIAFGGTGVPILPDSRLRECDYGDLNGCLSADLRGTRVAHIATPYPDGQSFNEVTADVELFLAELAAAWDGKRVLIIGHTATRWALDKLILGVPLEQTVDAPFDWKPGWEYVLRRNAVQG